MTGDVALLAPILILPLIGGVAVFLLGLRANLRETATLITAVALFAAVLRMLFEVADGARPEWLIADIAPGLNLSLKVEPLGAMFAAIASGLWIVNSIYSIGYMRGNAEKDQTRFFFFFTIAIFGAMGVATAGDLFTLFIFYEILTLSTYPLVAHKGNDTAKQGARVYLAILLFTSIGLLLPAIVGVYVVGASAGVENPLAFYQGGVLPEGTSDLVVGVLLVLFAFGIGKAALMPVHPWLPNAMVAPTPVSALLHAVAVVKAGVFSILKVALYVFGADTIQANPAADGLAIVAGVSIVLASVIAISADNLKRRLAFSTVSQLSYVTLGAMLATPAALLGAALQILMHAVGKITLFMTAGGIYTATKKTEISTMRGLGRLMPVTFAAYSIGALSIIGIPPLAGVWPKLELMIGGAQADKAWVAMVLVASSVLNVGYLLPIAVRGYLRPPDPGNYKTPPAAVWAAPAVTAVVCVIAFFAVGHVSSFLAPIFDAAPAIEATPTDAAPTDDIPPPPPGLEEEAP